MTVLDTEVGGPQLRQQRRLVTEIPGPRSRELANRREAALPAGLTSSAAVYAASAGGGVLVDVDGNSFIDLGSGIAVTTVGNAAQPPFPGMHHGKLHKATHPRKDSTQRCHQCRETPQLETDRHFRSVLGLRGSA